MGASKQKWKQEEEAAHKAGVIKHGDGKWRTILKDPQFCRILYLHSNVDLKDKWRNICVMPNGFGMREKSYSRVAPRKGPIQLASSKHEEATTSVSDGIQSDEDMIDVQPLVVSSPPLQIQAAPKRSIVSAVKAHQFFTDETWDSLEQIFDTYMREASKLVVQLLLLQ